MNVYPVNIENEKSLHAVCEKIGADNRALMYLTPKFKIFHIYADDIDFRAANFLKQELLSLGGDVVVAKHVIDAKTEFTDILLMSTKKQLIMLQEKIKAMNIWGIKEFREKLSEIITNIKINEWELISPNNHIIKLNMHTKLMGIINLTPDSFFEGSRVNEKNIIERTEKLINDGAYIIDIGAESTRPGAKLIDVDEEKNRLLPALRILRENFPDIIISVDTYKPEIAKISCEYGADMINDVSGLVFVDGMPEMIASLKMPYVLSHNKYIPEKVMYREPYEDIMRELIEFFEAKLDELRKFNVDIENVMIDPGIGFSKGGRENFEVLRNIESLKIFGLPLMIGHSRKKFTGDDISGTTAITALMNNRVSLLRVHDVKENMNALRISQSFMND